MALTRLGPRVINASATRRLAAVTGCGAAELGADRSSPGRPAARNALAPANFTTEVLHKYASLAV